MMPLTFKNIERPPQDIARGLAAAAAVFDRADVSPEVAHRHALLRRDGLIFSPADGAPMVRSRRRRRARCLRFLARCALGGCIGVRAVIAALLAILIALLLALLLDL
jgi:hypothetical protein